MSQVINTNVASLNSQRTLGSSGASLASSLQRLSSGLRINSAKDDSAGLAISQRMTAQIRGLNQATRNANDGISLAQTAEGALNNVSESLQRMRELAVQASNATNSAQDRAALQAEVNQLVEQINTVASQTSFNGIKLLDGTFNSQSFQVGANAGEKIDISSIASAKADALGVGTTSSYQTTINEGVVSNGRIASGGITVNGFGIGPSISDGVSFELGAVRTASSAVLASANTRTFAAPDPATYDAADGTVTISGLQINGITIDDFAIHTAGADSTQEQIANRIVVAITNAGISGLTAENAGNAVRLSRADGGDILIAGGGATTGLVNGTNTGTALDTSYTTGAFSINGTAINQVTIASGTSAADAVQQIVDGINADLAGAEVDITASVENGRIQLTSSSTGIAITGTPTGTGLTAGTTNVDFIRSDSSAISKASAFNAVTGQTGVSAKATATELTSSAVTLGAIAGDNTNSISVNGVRLNSIAAGANIQAQANNITAAINAVSNQTGVTATFNQSGEITMTAADGRNIALDVRGTAAAVSGLQSGVTFGGLTLNSTSADGITLGGADLASAGLSARAGTNAAEATFGTGVSTIDISTANGAQNAISTIDAALQNINSSRANLGAIQNRFSSAVSNLQTTSENISASRSRILDADFAAETANLSRAQILQQAGTAMLAQANSIPQNVLSLLR